MPLHPIVRLLRPRHWLKNLLVFVPLVFSGRITQTPLLASALAAFVSFSLGASFVYVVNDLMDVQSDRNHPIKSKRPIASGEVSPFTARVIAGLLLVASMGICITMTHIPGLVVLSSYLAVNIAYSIKLKTIPILDVVVLASGFLLRVVYGAIACGVEVSGWLYLTVLTGSFYLGLGKRRGEIDSVGMESRTVLSGYTREFLDKNMYVFLGLTIAFYALWARESGARLWTVPLVMVIFMRYSLDIESGGDGDPMSVVTHDGVLLTLIVCYVALVLMILYGPWSAR